MSVQRKEDEKEEQKMAKKKSKMSSQDKALRDLVAYYEKLNQISKANEKNKEQK